MCVDESRIAHFMCVVKTKKKNHGIIFTGYLTQVKGGACRGFAGTTQKVRNRTGYDIKRCYPVYWLKL